MEKILRKTFGLLLFLILSADYVQADNQLSVGIKTVDNSIVFDVAGLPSAAWGLNGDLQELRLIDTVVQGNIQEYNYIALYQENNQRSQLLLTQRILPNKDRMIFIKVDALEQPQQFLVEIPDSENFYGSEAFRYIDKGEYNTLITKVPFKNNNKIDIAKGESLDQWYIFAAESLGFTDNISKQAWETSLKFHQTNTWVTPKGTHRYTPVEYLEVEEYKNKNINLQASVPMLLIESLQVTNNRLIEDFVHNAKFTLLQMQDGDGFWRTKINVAYLNRAYRLGPNFIDTRMSTDASLFLLRYGLHFEDSEAIEKSLNFKNYFRLLKEKGIVYQKNQAIIYPDYYSEAQNSKTLVSLNHAIYEINYLYTLYNWLGDKEAKELADEMLLFIKETYLSWIKENGDLYYALGPTGEYYGEDYENVTYIDLFILESILKYMGYSTKEISFLLAEKAKYLDQIDSGYPESHLEYEELFNNFDQLKTQKGNLTFSYPLDIAWNDEADIAYLSYGAYHFIKGADRISFNGDTTQLDSTQKYMVIITADSLYILDELKIKKSNRRLF